MTVQNDGAAEDRAASGWERRGDNEPPYRPAGPPMEAWNTPMYSLQTRLEICAGAVAFEHKVAENMRAQRDALKAASPPVLPPGWLDRAMELAAHPNLRGLLRAHLMLATGEAK